MADLLLRDRIISLEEVEIVEYGLESFGSNLLGMSITLLIGYWFDFFEGSFWLWLLIFPLRKNAGGFHAETKGKCLLFSSALLLVSIKCFVQIEWSVRSHILVTVLSYIVIFLMAPVETCNKQLNQAEYKVYRKRTRLILLSEGVLFVAAVIWGWRELITVITIDFFIVGTSLTIGKAKLRNQKKITQNAV